MAHGADGGLRGGVVLLGGAAKPFQRLVVVAVHAAFVRGVEHAQPRLTGGIPLSGGQQIPFCRFGHVALQPADSALVKGAQRRLRLAVPPPGGATIPANGLRHVAANILAQTIGLGQGELRLGVAGFGALGQGGNVRF